MSDDDVSRSAAAATPLLVPPTATPDIGALFLGFLKVTVSGFGSVLPWARREFVSVRRWMSQDEFNELFSLCQFLPGPNIVTFALIYGYRVRGVAGAAVATAALLVPPVLLMMCVGALFDRYGELSAVRDGLTGLAAAAAGLLVSSAVQMAEPLFRGRRLPAIMLWGATFVAAGILQWPLLWVIAALVPVSIAVAWKSVS